MNTMKKVLALVMVLAMVAVLFAAAPMAYAAGGVSMSLSGEGDTVTLTVTINDALSLGGIHLVFEVPDGFELQSSSYPSGLTLTAGTNDYLLETTGTVELPAGSTIFTAVYKSSAELEEGDYPFSVSVTEAYSPAPDFDDYNDFIGTSASATYSIVAPGTPTADPDSGEVEAGTEVKFSCETEGAEIYYSTDGGKTWTQGDSFVVNEDVTIQVKAVKGNLESKIAEFSYTIKEEPIETPAPTEKPAEPTPAPTEKPAEPTPAPTEKPAEPTPAPTEKPAEPTPAPATPTPKPVNPVNPTTGDESNLVLYVVIMVATLALGAVTFVVIRKGNKA